MRFPSIYLLLFLLASSCLVSQKGTAAIRDSVKPEVYQRAVGERDIQVGSSLKTDRGAGEFKFYGLMLVHATPAKARGILMNYPLYQKMVPYVSRSEYDEKSKLLWIEGGIFGWRLQSALKLEVKSEQPPITIEYSIERGHFTGLKGRVTIESQSPGKSLVLFTGSVSGTHWPPTWIMERGSEIVFGLTARRMRSLMESETESTPESKPDSSQERPSSDDIPKPRKRI